VSRSERQKGARTENELAAKLSKDLGRVVKRKLGQARDSGDDIQVEQFRIESKARKAFSVWGFMDQCQAACGPGDVPVVALRANGRPWLVLMRYEDAIPMIRGELK
jgi:hypothetical protein